MSSTTSSTASKTTLIVAQALWELTSNFKDRGTEFWAVPDGVKDGFVRKAQYLVDAVESAGEVLEPTRCNHQWFEVGRKSDNSYLEGQPMLDVTITFVCPSCDAHKELVHSTPRR